MKRDDWDFMERIDHDLEARRMACQLLDVDPTADQNQLKRAYRRVAMKYHPDQNVNDPDADKKFKLVRCAYELLSEDKPCPDLLREINTWRGVPEDERYHLDNPWGHFLWWRDKFFGSL